MNRVNFLDCPVDIISVPDIYEWIWNTVNGGKPCQISVVNANKLYQMAHNPNLQNIIKSSDLIIPEWAVVWGTRQLGLPSAIHSGGLLLMKGFFDYAAEKGLRPYLLGSEQKVVETLVKKLQHSFPGLDIAGYHDGYFSERTTEQKVITEIRDAKPDILFVALGSPRQEVWIFNHKEILNVPVSIGVGGSFDVLAGIKSDAPNWARGRGLEWFYRLMQNPKAYWKRYLLTNSWFIWQVEKTRLRQIFLKI